MRLIALSEASSTVGSNSHPLINDLTVFNRYNNMEKGKGDIDTDPDRDQDAEDIEAPPEERPGEPRSQAGLSSK